MSDVTLSLMIFIPLVGAAVVLALPSRAHDLIRWAAVGASVPPLLLAIRVLAQFTPDAGFQFVHHVPWIPAFGIEYFVGMSDPLLGRNDPGRILVQDQANNQRDDQCEQKAGQDLSFNGAQSH